MAGGDGGGDGVGPLLQREEVQFGVDGCVGVRDRVAAGDQLQVLAQGEGGEERVLVEQGGDLAAKRDRVLVGRQPVGPDLAVDCVPAMVIMSVFQGTCLRPSTAGCGWRSRRAGRSRQR